MSTNLTEELADLNTNARELIEKIDGFYNKLDTKTQSSLDSIQALLDSGNVAQADNALKLEGKTLAQVKKEAGAVLQTKFVVDNNTYSTTDSVNYIKATDNLQFDNPISEGSKVVLMYMTTTYRHSITNHDSPITFYRNNDEVNLAENYMNKCIAKVGTGYNPQSSGMAEDITSSSNSTYSLRFKDHGGSVTFLGAGAENGSYKAPITILMMEVSK